MKTVAETLASIHLASAEHAITQYNSAFSTNSFKMCIAYEIANDYRIVFCLTGEAMYDEMAGVWESTGNNHLAAFRLDANG